jgi:glycosyltransferase involved in cell wall biosynthesis
VGPVIEPMGTPGTERVASPTAPPGPAARAWRPGVAMLLANVEGSVGGAQQQARLLAHEVSLRGSPVIVVSQSPGVSPKHRRTPEDGVAWVALPVLGPLSRSSFLLSFLLWAVVNRRRFHVIHAHSTSAGLTAGLVGAVLRKPVVVKVTGMQAVHALVRPQPAWRLRRWLLNRTATVVVAVSAEMMRALADAGIGDDRRLLVANGVRPAVLDPAMRAATKCAWLGPDAGHVVLYVGRLTGVKAPGALLRMWSAMPHRDAATLLIVGDGPLRAELEREAAARGLGPSVRFVGSHPDVTPFYLIADVFVLPSVTEGLSNALLEAMAAGLPAVASDVGGNREVLEDGVSGFLADWADTTATATLVAKLLEDAELRRRVGDGARRRAASYAIAAVAERYCRLYETLTAGDLSTTSSATPASS